MRTLLLAIIAIGAATVLQCGDHGNGVSGGSQGGFSVPSSGAAPLSIISLGASTLSDSAVPKVCFANTNGYTATVVATAANPLEVAVPLFINPATGKLDSGTVGLTVLYPDGTTKAVQGTLKIAAPPMVTAFPPGALTAAFLQGSIALIADAQVALDSAALVKPAADTLVTSDIMSSLTSASTRLTAMRASVTAFLAGFPGDSIGSVATSSGPVTVKIDSVTMRNSDRIIAAFLNQIAPAGQSLARELPGQASAASNSGLGFAQTWDQTFTGDVSAQWLDWARKVGGTVSAVTAVAGLAAAFSATAPAMVALGTTAAIVGGMGFVVSTFAPATCAIFLKMGSSILINGQASERDYMPEIKYVIGNTVAQGLSYLRGAWLEKVGSQLSAAIFDIMDVQLDFTGKTSNFVAGAVDLVYPPGSDCPVTFSPKSKSMLYSGGSGTVSVIAGSGCTWDVLSGAPWISVTSGANMSGSGTVTYQVSANPSSAQRVGTIFIADTLYTITQAGKPSPPAGALDGSWVGQYTGTFVYLSGATWQWDHEPLELTISGSTMTWSTPIYGTTTMPSSGSGTWGFPGDFNFTGSFSSDGTAGGTWTITIPGNTNQSGTGNGTWTATKQ